MLHRTKPYEPLYTYTRGMCLRWCSVVAQASPSYALPIYIYIYTPDVWRFLIIIRAFGRFPLNNIYVGPRRFSVELTIHVYIIYHRIGPIIMAARRDRRFETYTSLGVRGDVCRERKPIWSEKNGNRSESSQFSTIYICTSRRATIYIYRIYTYIFFWGAMIQYIIYLYIYICTCI